jgi:hypothetical protein
MAMSEDLDMMIRCYKDTQMSRSQRQSAIRSFYFYYDTQLLEEICICIFYTVLWSRNISFGFGSSSSPCSG